MYLCSLFVFETMLRLTLLFFISFITTSNLFSQTTPFDSLKEELLHYLHRDSNQLLLLIEIARISENEVEVINHAKQAEALAKELHSTKHLSTVYSIISNYYRLKGLTDSCNLYNNKNIELAAKTGNDDDLFLALYNSAAGYFTEGQHEKAIVYGNKAKSIVEKQHNLKSLARVTNLLASSYAELGLMDKAIDYSQKTIDIQKQLKDTFRIITATMNLATIYHDIKDFNQALKLYNECIRSSKDVSIPESFQSYLFLNISGTHTNLGNTDSALMYALKGLDLKRKIGYDEGIASALNEVAGIYRNQKKYTEALNYYKQSQQYLQNYKQSKSTYYLYINLAILFNDLNKTDSAIYYGNLALDFAEKAKALVLLRHTHYQLSSIYEKKQDAVKALEHYKKYDVLKDSIHSEESQAKMANLKIAFDIEQKDKKIETLTLQDEIKQQKLKETRAQTLFIFLLFILIICVIMLFVYFKIRNQKLKQENALSELKQRLLTSQMNPHFMSNALASIQNYLVTGKEKEAANYLGKYGELTRQILESSRSNDVVLEDEIQLLDHYLQIQQLISPKKFDYHINIDPSIDPSYIEIPPMLIQPFVENAIKHGVSQGKGSIPGTIYLSFFKKDLFLEVQVKDNGTGFHTNNQENRKSYALDITKERIAYLNKNNKNKIGFTMEVIKENTDISGTLVTIKIPLNEL